MKMLIYFIFFHYISLGAIKDSEIYNLGYFGFILEEVYKIFRNKHMGNNFLKDEILLFKKKLEILYSENFILNSFDDVFEMMARGNFNVIKIILSQIMKLNDLKKDRGLVFYRLHDIILCFIFMSLFSIQKFSEQNNKNIISEKKNLNALLFLLFCRKKNNKNDHIISLCLILKNLISEIIFLLNFFNDSTQSIACNGNFISNDCSQNNHSYNVSGINYSNNSHHSNGMYDSLFNNSNNVMYGNNYNNDNFNTGINYGLPNQSYYNYNSMHNELIKNITTLALFGVIIYLILNKKEERKEFDLKKN